MSQATQAMGVKLSKMTGSPIAPVPLAEVKTLKWTGRSLDFADVTNMDSTGNVKEFLPTLFNPGELDAEINYLVSVTGESTQPALETDYAARTLGTWRIEFPKTGSQSTGAFFEGSAYVQEISPDFDPAKQQMASVKLKCTGQWGFTAGS